MKKIASLLLATLMTVSLVGCGDSSESLSGTNDIYPEEGYAEGGLEDVMHTYFFNYTVNSAYICEEYEGYVPADGFDLLVADVTVKNTSGESITMYDTDFQIQWGDDDNDDAFDVPVTYYMETTQSLGDDVFPYEYDLANKESRTGLLIFEVPEGEPEYSLSYLEYFDDDTSGDVFFVFFSAEKK